MACRGRLIAFLTALLFAPILTISQASADGTVITVVAKSLWKNTLITVHAGDRITISATGSWTWGGDGKVGPDGDPIDDYNAYDLFEPFDFFSQARLIAFIGTDPYQGRPGGDTSFFPQESGYISVGSGQTFIAPYSGRLWLGFNDGAGTGATGDNTGEVKATVTVNGPGTAGPSIAISTPGGVYQQGDSVLAGYSCTDPDGASIVKCAGAVASGTAVDTSQPGHYAFTVIAQDSNGNSSTQTVGYVVTDGASAAITPTGGAFEPTFVGTKSSLHAFTLVNPLSSAITLSGVSLATGYSGGFQLYGTNCGTTLAAHHSCLIKVYFKPAVGGIDRSEIDVAASVPVAPVPLWGYATQAVMTPAAVVFSDQATGTTSAPQTVVLKNTQTVPLVINEIAVTGNFAVDPSTTCAKKHKQLAAGSYCLIAVTFTPTDAGPRTGSLTINGSVPIAPFSVSLGGNGTSP